MIQDLLGKERQTIQNLAGLLRGNRVLEVGCGDGRLTQYFAGTSRDLVALEICPDAMKQARALGSQGVGFALGSGERLPIADHSVDTVVFSLSLHHQDPFLALAEAQRVLVDSGRIFILEPSYDALINRLFRLVHNEDEACKRAAKAINSCGLEVMEQGTYSSTFEFEDFDELVQYIYGYLHLQPESSQVREMADILGKKQGNRPLEIEDSTHWWILCR